MRIWHFYVRGIILSRMTMKRKNRVILSVIGIAAVFVISYAIAHGLVLLYPPSEQNAGFHAILTLLLILILLAAPYFALKLMSHAAHLKNPEEKEIHLRDFPKDKKQFNASQK